MFLCLLCLSLLSFLLSISTSISITQKNKLSVCSCVSASLFYLFYETCSLFGNHIFHRKIKVCQNQSVMGYFIAMCALYIFIEVNIFCFNLHFLITQTLVSLTLHDDMWRYSNAMTTDDTRAPPMSRNRQT